MASISTLPLPASLGLPVRQKRCGGDVRGNRPRLGTSKDEELTPYDILSGNRYQDGDPDQKVGQLREILLHGDVGMTKMTKIMSDDRLAAAQFQAILYSASQGIIGVDYAGTIQLANPKAEEMFGYADGELLGQSIEVLVPEHVRPIHAEERERYSEYPRARSMGLGMELKGRRRDGSEFRVEISLNHVQAGDEAMTLSLIVDVTERVEMEEHARKAHKMDAVSRLAGRVADEFTGVLTSLSGSNSVALARCEGDALLRSSLEETSKATDRAAILARQLWVFASGQIAEPMWFDPNQRLSRMDGLLGRLLGENIELELALGEDVGEILADP